MNLRNAILEGVVKARGRRATKRLQRDARDPERVQVAVLRRILRAQARTDYAIRYRFDEIRTVEDFRAWVQVNEYEDLRPWIERQDLDGKAYINAQTPISYAMTSGTTGKPKYVPVLKSTLEGQKRIQDLFLYKLLQDRPRVLQGHILAIVSPAVEGHARGSGLPVGSTSGQMVESAPGLVQSKYVVPSPVLSIEDYDTRYLAILRLALQHSDLSYITTANPSTIVRLITLARTYWKELVDDVERGGFHRMDGLSADQRRALEQRLEANPARARELRRRGSDGQTVRIRDLWPDLQAVGVWTGGSSSIFFEQLRGEFPEHTLIRDIGYLSSEFRGSVPMSSATSAGIPSFQDNFFEFVRRNEWDRGEAHFVGLHQLVDGEQYYVFITTDAGLYRYNMNDIVQAEGFYRRVPLLRFVQKGKGVTNISGEKLYESQVIQSVSKIESAHGLASSFYLMAADEQNARYVLYYEPVMDATGRALAESDAFEGDLDRVLAELNVEYAVKRKSGRIASPRLCVLRQGTFDRFKRSCLARGQREGQFKIVALQYQRDLHFDFERQAEVRRSGESEERSRRNAPQAAAIMERMSLAVRPLRIPFRSRVKHAAAERRVSESIWVEMRRGTVTAVGEGCPRSYVTGESAEEAVRWIAAIGPEVMAAARSLEALRAFVDERSPEIDRHPAAWCAAETALLDLFAREARCTVEELLGLAPAGGRYQYSAVVSDEPCERLAEILRAYLAVGFSDFKFKISGDLVRDLEKVRLLEGLAQERSAAVTRVRLDANNLWAGKPDAALRYLEAFECPLFAVEEPLEPRAVEELSRLSTRLAVPVILDETLCRASDVDLFDGVAGEWIANLRVSKLGGLLRTLDVIEKLSRRGWKVVLGAHVGETSVLTRAALVAARAAGDALVAQEGAFGTLLLERDMVTPTLMFGQGGALEFSASGAHADGRFGLGLEIAQGRER